VAEWIDLLDPSPEELRAHLPEGIHPRALEQLLAPPVHDDEPRPKLEGHGNYIFGVFLVAVLVPNEDRIYYQEVDLIGTREQLLTIRKTPERGEPFEITEARAACRPDEVPGMNAYHLIDAMAERYLDLVDGLNDEIDELEDNVESMEPEETRLRLSGLRHDLLHVRRTLGPMRDAVRGVIDNRVELDDGGPTMLTREVELNFGAAYDKFLRATDGLELSRDLVAGVRDYLQSKISNDQNEVTKKLTVIASVLLLPTFIVGLYGQNFRHHFPELGWQWGYAWSWGLIVVTTVAQLVFFRRRGWI
jgi:magnesium transporter